MLGVIGESTSPSPDPDPETPARQPGDRPLTSEESGPAQGIRVAVHQPHYLPWLGMVDKLDRCDRFVVLDTVQFERRGWQNRNYVAGRGRPVLLTVPVNQGSRDDRILDKVIDNSQKWRSKHYKALAEHCYSKTPYWSDFKDEIVHLYETEWNDLAELAIATMRSVMRGFGIDTPILRASEIGDFPGQKSELLAQICAKTGADVLLSGDGARDYLNPEILLRYGIDVEWQGFQHPVYRQHQREADDFAPRLSALDLLFNAGPDALEILRRARTQS
ncbi:WbqC family protein [Nocardiopsis sp. DSM 44743]|uniref:WbqC family protein n=1 Tax=Nocardiopsis lambiniae TaxID=3075539 RepID=A0ABU2M5Y7_9ACTN|nr:WbqC family protein [Nocardiopsis sp. DSM 44743]MDT0327999.1 WbqC family protein [Nocardiopsis sp. DSM 44743]